MVSHQKTWMTCSPCLATDCPSQESRCPPIRLDRCPSKVPTFLNQKQDAYHLTTAAAQKLPRGNQPGAQQGRGQFEMYFPIQYNHYAMTSHNASLDGSLLDKRILPEDVIAHIRDRDTLALGGWGGITETDGYHQADRTIPPEGFLHYLLCGLSGQVRGRRSDPGCPPQPGRHGIIGSIRVRMAQEAASYTREEQIASQMVRRFSPEHMIAVMGISNCSSRGN